MSSSEKIKQFRKAKGLTQKQLADLTGLAEITIRQYEAGKYEPKIDKLRRIAAALGVYIYELEPDWSKIPFEDITKDLNNGTNGITHEEAIKLGGYPITKIENQLLENYRELNDTGQQEAVRQVELLTKIPEYRKEDTSE